MLNFHHITILLLLVCGLQYRSEASSLLTRKFKHYNLLFDSDDDGSINETNSDIGNSTFVFRPAEIEDDEDNTDYEYDNLQYELFDTNSTLSPEQNATKPKHLDAIFEFVQYFLEPTEVYQNTVYETVNQKENIFLEDLDKDNNEDLERNKHGQHWLKKGNVCSSKISRKIPLDEYTTIDSNSTNLYLELLDSMSEIANIIKSNYKDSNKQTEKFFSDFNQLYDLISSDEFNTNTNKKWTVYLWDNRSMINYIRTSVLGGTDTLSDLMSTILNHFVDYHYPTQSIIKNDDLIKLNTAANRQLRLSTFNLYDKSLEFVNCRRLEIRDRYYKPVNFDGAHNYRFLIHKLEDNGLLALRTETAYQVLHGQLFNQSNSHNNNLKILQQILAKSSTQLLRDLNDDNNPVTVFLPTDAAFKDIRQDQIDSLIADQACGYRFFRQYVVKDEICTGQLFKYEAEYSSHVQEASFITMSDKNGKRQTFFNGQQVAEQVGTYESSNGMFYFLNTLRINNMVDFMYDMVSYLKHRTGSIYFDHLMDNWRDVLLTESIKSTLLLPIEASILSSRGLNLTEDYNAETNFNKTKTKIDIRDYLIDSHETYYKLRDGQVLMSKTKRKYLVNTFTFGLPQFLSWVPTRNFHIKAINCQRIEINDLKGCSSQILFFHNKKFTLPPLNKEGLLDFISSDKSLSIFNELIKECGNKCLDIYRYLDGNSGGMIQEKKGHTVFMPSNRFFKLLPEKLAQLRGNSTQVEYMIKSNTLYGTFCEFYLRYEYAWRAKNLLGIEVKDDEFAINIGKSELDAYMSESSVLVHKLDFFRVI